MRLLYITVSMPFGAGEEFFIPEVNELRRQGCEVCIVPRSPKGSIVNQDAAGLAPHTVGRSLLSPAVLWGAVREFARRPVAVARAFALLFGSGGLRVFAKNTAVFPKGLWLAGLARKWQAEHIHAQWGLTTATMAMVASELTGIPWSFTAHRADIAEPNLLGPKSARAAFTRYISMSGMRMAEQLGAQGRKGAAGVVIHMGVEPPSRSAIRSSQRSPAIILCPASFYPVKGHTYLLEAMGLLQKAGVPVTLRLAGEGGLQPQLRQQAQQVGRPVTVEFLGHVAHDRLLEWYREGQIDVVVLPSVDLGHNLHEGIPVSLMEAMAHGVAVVATRTGGIPELLHDGAGVMVPEKDAAALAEAIERLVRDHDLRARIGRAGRQRIEDHFSVGRTVSRFLLLMQTHALCNHFKLQ